MSFVKNVDYAEPQCIGLNIQAVVLIANLFIYLRLVFSRMRNFTVFKQEVMNQNVLHGLLLVLCCCLYVGAALLLFRFNPEAPILLSWLLFGLYVFIILEHKQFFLQEVMTWEQFLGFLFALCCFYVGISIFLSSDLHTSSRVAFLLRLCTSLLGTLMCIVFYFAAFPVTSNWIDIFKKKRF
ncbi:hypothetical protein TNCT_242781 [Trichonephila clavata]|uniref:Uncharacterized protein n=1 Tax=Trichonephila clavata TaxID=2740835 RepID=A0A8X6KUQ6_TRICU|nr:hypothetical protein TNCT_242781 [Trichonephila clavata]